MKQILNKMQRISKKCFSCLKISHLKHYLKIENWKLKINKRPLALALAILITLTSIFALTYRQTPTAQAAWYSDSWNYRQKIIIDHTKVPNTNQTDFPVLIKITDANNAIFTKAKADGSDIRFTSSNQTTELNFEIEQFSTGSNDKALWAWVKIPTLSFTTDTTIYLYYGNATATAPSTASKTAVWSNGYAGVWHMGDAGPETAQDSTLNANNGTQVGGVSFGTTGKIGKAATFNDNLINAGSSATLDSANRTVTAWFKAGQNRGGYRGIVAKESGGPFLQILLTTGTGTLYLDEELFGVLNSSAAYDDDIWHQVTVVRDNVSKTVTAYIDNQVVSGPRVYAGEPPINTSRLTIGGSDWSGGLYKFIGTIDQPAVSNVARTPDWIATEYANQNDPSLFETFGTAETADSYAPNNPSSITALYSPSGTPIANNAGSDSTPYFSWPEPEVAGGATDQTGAYISGVAGYYSYFGTSCGAGGADPAMSRGVLSDTGGGLHYSSDLNISVPDLTTNQGTYCLRIKTKDNAGNVSTSSTNIVYNYDTTAPNAPTFVSVNPAGYSSVDSFTMSWPVATDAGSGGSGVGGYQYKRGGTSGDAWSATISTSSINNVQKYQDGANIFLVRSIDNAGNTSTEVQTTYYYSANPPTKPTSLTATPALSETNSFAFSWTAPANPARPIVDYGYSINAAPFSTGSNNNITWTGSSATTLAADAYATIQGANTFYLVARDDSGAYSFSDASVATVSFNCTTAVPSAPQSVTITDSSNRAYETYSLTIKWSAGAGQGLSFSHYLIERSTDPQASEGQGFVELATTSSNAYIDVDNLINTATYSYRIKAIDNADSTSASSQIVSRIPTGKYTTAPTIIQGPESTAKASTATIKWVTNRTATAGVRFGTDRNNLTRSQIDPTESTEHTITIPGLDGGQKYYYQVQSLDNERDYSSESAYSAISDFETLPLPVIADVKISNITLSSADLSWITSTASNSKASYGTTLAYGTDYEENDSFTTNHTYKFTKLSHTSSYHFKLTGTDQDGNTLVSDDYIFDTLPMPKISAVNFETDLTGSEPKSYITWTTNVPTTSSVEYSPKGGNATFEESQSSYITTHKVELSKLSDNTSYSFYVYGTDQFGNKTQSDEYIFATPFDSRAAVISDVSVETSNVGLNKQDKAQIVVSWHTDEPASTQVEYGEGVSGDYTSKTSEDKTLSNEHFVIVSDLLPNKPYHFRAISRDKGNNLTSSEDINTVPGEVPKSILQMLLQSFEETFGWLGRLIGSR